MAGDVVGMMTTAPGGRPPEVLAELARALTTLQLGVQLLGAVETAAPDTDRQRLIEILVAAAQRTVTAVAPFLEPARGADDGG